ncbi:MAG: ATP-binding cassette, subfamily bacterial, partial [Thermoleophilales bacterium]|nr:ATP-binding cassette, subfamily bacterial [Thermoleophilales bacterium]
MRTFLRLLGFLRPYRRGVIWSFVLAAIAMLAGVAIPALVGKTIDAVRQGEHQVWPYGLAIVGAGLLRLLFSVARRLIAGRLSLGVEFDLRNRMYGHLQSLELAFFDGQQTGQLMSRSTVDLQSVRFFLGYGLIFIAQSMVTIVVAATVMLVVNWQLALVALAPVPFIIFAAARYGRLNRPASQEVQQRIAELTAEAEENVSGIRLVKAFAREERQLARFGGATRRVFDQSMVSTRLRAFYNPLIGFLPQVGLAAILLVGGHEAVNGTITIGEFVAFYGYVMLLSAPVRMLGIALGMAQRAVASGARVFEVLDRAPAMTSPPDAPALPEGDGRVELRGVTFAYDDAPEPVLRGIDLDVAAGQTVALVGGTGSGKTTLVSLIPRLYDPTEGSVVVDGVDIREIELESLRREIAMVSDDPFLFSATVRENVAYARPDASFEDIQEAARQAGIHDFIAGLPDGYETLVGERGLTLSGGQRQRVAIARALLRDPRILILDDATSSVDATTEAEIKNALRGLMRARTTFIIGHRLSTIALADEI